MTITPIRRQYLKIKQQYPQAIVFFRLGDFYETFDEDAKTTASVLEITLTSKVMGKGQRVPLAGIPYHAVDNYLAKLINKGYKVAICEQIGVPGKGLVQREVVRLVTPGTVIEPGLLADTNNNYLVSLVTDDETAGIAYVDISTGEFATTQLPVARVFDEIERLQPSEILLPEHDRDIVLPGSPSITRLDVYWFDLETATQLLTEHFGVITLDGYGCSHLPLAIRAAGAVAHYIGETQKSILNHINRLATYSTNAFMTIDGQTRRNLEILSSNRSESGTGSLLSVIDLTRTPMGGRLLKKWLGQPLLDIAQITRRQEAISKFYNSSIIRQKVLSVVKDITDIERIIYRVKSDVATPRDVITLRSSLEKLPELKEYLTEIDIESLLSSELRMCDEVVNLIHQSIVDEPGVTLEKGGVIKKGFSEELDRLRMISSEARKYLASIEQKEREDTGVKSLKVRYNRVFGYYIEVSNSNLDRVPDHYIRKQTLTGAERFYTPELKEYESTILNAQDQIVELESTIFRQVTKQIADYGEQIIQSSGAIAEIDVFLSLAEVAARNNYIKPELDESDTIHIKEGRHPVVEKSIGEDGFVSNDTYLCNEDTQVVILTGPNMSGKSTYLKQVALIVLLAQIGSYIPAASANIGIVDRIFTRIGAQEDLAAGQSTFMVEMVETANILNNATSKSLIILDEVGRGTSTYDGLSIAWAVVEFIHNQPRLRAKTLFATHYHELVELAQFLPHVKNYNVAVMEEKGKVIFLHKIVPGGADKSYGIYVAKLAGLPLSVIRRAQEVLSGLEQNLPGSQSTRSVNGDGNISHQLSFFDSHRQLIDEISKLDVDSMSPLDAISRLYELKQKAEDDTSKRA